VPLRTALYLGLLAFGLQAAEPSYLHDLRPILQRQCQGCHQPALASSKLDVTSLEAFRAGGQHGPAFQPGAPAESLVVKYLSGELKPQMPFAQPPLPPEQIQLFRDWIAAGAKDDTPPAARDVLATGQPMVYTQPPVLTALAFSPDGKTLAVSAYREVLLHSPDGSRPPRRLAGVSERLLSLAFSQDGGTLVAGGGTPARFGEIQVWDVAAGVLRRSVTLTNDTVFGASLSPDASLVAVGAADNTVRLLEAASGKELRKIGNHENWVLGTVFSTDGKRIVSVGGDRAAKLTDVASGAFLENLNLLRGELAAVARHPSKDVVVIGGEDRTPYVYLMDRPKNMKIADDSTLVLKLERQDGAISALAWSPDGRRIAVAGAGPAVNIYDAGTGERVAACKGHTAGIYTIAFSPDSKVLATGGFDGQVRTYDAASGSLLHAFTPVPIVKETSQLGSAP
jgi:WD40 repeat protein